MMQRGLFLIILFLLRAGSVLPGPADYIPLPPVMKNVTVSNSSSAALLTWSASPSPDIAGYVVYKFRNGEGYAIDTLWNPASLNYADYSTGAFYFPEAYVVAAIDSEMNISPLSNAMSTIFLTGTLDTCNSTLILEWNSFTPSGTTVQEYQLLAGLGSGEMTTVQSLGPEVTSFGWDGFAYYENYRLIVRALMAGSSISESNLVTVSTDMERPPEWIELVSLYASDEGSINIVTRYDPAAETKLFNIMRKEAEGDSWSLIGTLNSTSGSFLFVDSQASITSKYIYRVDAVNNCGVPVVSSVTAGNIVLGSRSADNIITFSWNTFTGWPGELSGYEFEYIMGGELFVLASPSATDTLYLHDYRDIMYGLTSGEICYRIRAIRNSGDESDYRAISNTVCIETIESVFVPTAFSPDGNGVNDYFVPVMPFTPVAYRLMVRDRSGRLVFSSDSPQERWDGTYSGRKLPPDVYLWYLRLQTPSAKVIERSGTVAIIYNNSVH